MARSKLVRCVAAVALAAALLFTPLPAAAGSEPLDSEAATRQEDLWARLLAWLPEQLTSVVLASSADIDPNGRPASTSPGTATSDYSSDIDPNG
jgi:hypothetical protein